MLINGLVMFTLCNAGGGGSEVPTRIEGGVEKLLNRDRRRLL